MNVEERLTGVFRRVFQREFNNYVLGVDDVDEWDSLSHIKLVIELEREFNLAIDSDVIPSLFSDFDTVLKFVRNHAS